jgi:hypothetical protein
MVRPATYQVVEIIDDGLPVYVAMQRVGERYLDLAWKCRHVVDNALCNWLATLEAKPVCRVVLGNGTPLTWRTARALMQYQRQRIAVMAGSDGPPSFALWPAVNRGGCRSQRKCVRVRGGVVEAFASVEEAARSVGTTSDDVTERIDSGHPDKQGWAWLDGQPWNTTNP